YFFYMCDKVVAPNVSLSTSMPQCKETTKTVEKISEVYKSFSGTSLKQQNGGKHKKSVFYQDIALEGQEKFDLKPRSGICASIEQPVPIKPANRRKTEQVSSRETTEDEMEINSDAQSSSQALTDGIGSDDDKGKMMEEVMKTYIKQQEKLHTILQKKQHLQMLAELRQRLDHAEADRQELQDELRQEREARQKLEKMIKELKLQIQKSSKNGKGK
ncbi:ski-like protein, partial [Protobothrops mucrosquamatus]|uniref:ski-like protein n=1 Tax=Protobothrops mucrosquamatus TaxID=103944 RepID=UPI000775CBA4